MIACVEKMPLPSDINPDVEFAAGDTTYLLVSPVWDSAYDFQTPVEISIAPDGRIFVADSAAHGIVVLEQAGNKSNGFDDLTDLKTDAGDNLSPIDVDIDKKMNVFYIDGSQQVYVWNQYFNTVGIDSIATGGWFYQVEGDTVWVESGTADWIEKANDPDWRLGDVVWGLDEVLRDSILAPHLFYDGAWPKSILADIYYESELSKFTGLSTTEDNADFIYVTDAHNNRIVRLDLERTYYLRMKSGVKIWTHAGIFGHTVTGYGTGAGTVNQPFGIDVDYAGNIYYSQNGDFFAVHKIKPVYTGGYIAYPSVFQQGVNDIMDLFRFSSPNDVAVDLNQFVYVANTCAREIQVFDSNGQFFKKAGVEEVTVDTTIWVVQGTDSVAIDTFYIREEKGFLVSPRAVTVDNRGVVYICDTGAGSVIRYRLSNQLDEDLTPVQ